MEKGDHLIIVRRDHEHHGLYVGDGKVIHYTSPVPGYEKGIVVLDTLAAFMEGGQIRVKYPTFRVYGSKESVERAYSRLGCAGNAPYFGNCEQFVNWCLFGVKYTRQVINGLGYVCVPMPGKVKKARTVATEQFMRLAGEPGCGAALVPVSQSNIAGLVAGAGAWATTSAIASGLLPGGGVPADPSCLLALPLTLGVAVGWAVKKFWDWL